MTRQFDFAPVDRILDNHPRSELSTIAILQDIQEHYHYLPREVFPYVAKAIGVGEARLYGVATFYENFSLEPKGKYIIKVCDGTACHVRKSQPIYDALHEYLGLTGEKKTSADGLFTLETVACLGACGLAPVMTVNDHVHSKMTPERALALLEDLKKEAMANE